VSCCFSSQCELADLGSRTATFTYSVLKFDTKANICKTAFFNQCKTSMTVSEVNLAPCGQKELSGNDPQFTLTEIYKESERVACISTDFLTFYEDPYLSGQTEILL
jgi:hypothetical protein